MEGEESNPKRGKSGKNGQSTSEKCCVYKEMVKRRNYGVNKSRSILTKTDGLALDTTKKYSRVDDTGCVRNIEEKCGRETAKAIEEKLRADRKNTALPNQLDL